MLTYLEKHRKGIALAASVLAVTAAALILALVPNLDIVVPAVVLLALLLVAALALFFQGIPLAVQLLASAALVAVGIAVLIPFRLYVPLPKGIDPQFFTGLSTVVVLLLSLAVPFPRRARENLQASLYPVQEEQSPAVEITYRQLMRKRRARCPYALDNRPPLQRALRMTIATVFFAAAFLLLLALPDLADFGMVADLPWQNPYVVPGLGGVLAVSFGVILLRFGYLRAGLSHAAIAGLALWFGYRLADIWAESRLRAAAMLLLLALLIVVVALGLTRYFRKKNAEAYFTLYKKEGRLIAFDFMLERAAPIWAYDSLTKFSLEFALQGSETPVGAVIAWLSAAARWRRFIFAGYQLQAMTEETMRLTAYVYAAQDCVDFLQKRLKKFGGKSLHISARKDAEYAVLRETLVPDDYTRYTLSNEQLHKALEKDGYDFSEPLPLIYTLELYEAQDVRDCVMQAGENGYFFAFTPVEEEDAETYEVFIQNFCSAGLEQLNLQVKKIMDYAERFHGRLADIGVLDRKDLDEFGRLPLEEVPAEEIENPNEND